VDKRNRAKGNGDLAEGYRNQVEGAQDCAEGSEDQTEGVQDLPKGDQGQAQGAEDRAKDDEDRTEGVRDLPKGDQGQVQGPEDRAKGNQDQAEKAQDRAQGNQDRTEQDQDQDPDEDVPQEAGGDAIMKEHSAYQEWLHLQVSHWAALDILSSIKSPCNTTSNVAISLLAVPHPKITEEVLWKEMIQELSLKPSRSMSHQLRMLSPS